MYPNQGFPGQQQFGAGYPQMPQQPFGAGYPQMPMPTTQGPMPMPGQINMPNQGQPFNYQQPGFPAQQPGFPPQQPGFPPQQQPGFPQQQPGFPPQQPGFPPQQQPGFPPQQPGFPPQQPSYPQQNVGQAYPQQPTMNQAFPQASGYPSMSHDPMNPMGAYQQSAPPQQQQLYQQQYAPSHQMAQPSAKGRPTVVPAANFNAANDAGALRKAMKGFGTDEDAIIEVLCRRTNPQRMEIVRTYKTSFGKDLVDDIKSETSGKFENLLVALLVPTAEFYAKELFEAMYGGGTDEDVLIEVMCSMTNFEIRSICATFQRLYGKSLEHELQSDTSGHFKRLMTSLSCGGRDESMMTDVNQAKIDAQELKRAGIDKWGTDESVFNRILCQRNHEQIKLIAREYQSLTGHTLEKDIKNEFSGDIEDGLLAVLRVAESRPGFFAQRLHKSMAGLGTNDRSLIRLVVTRCEIDMMDVKDEFQRIYGKTLKSFIKGDTSGHYKHALYALIAENRN